MTLGLVSTGDPTGQNQRSGTASLIVDQATVAEQSNNFGDNSIVRWTIKTDGSSMVLNFSDTNNSDIGYYSYLYILTASTYGVCLSPRGV
jgi:hypothetical protein